MTTSSLTWVGVCEERDPAGHLLRHYKRIEIDYDSDARVLEERHYRPDGTADYRYDYVYSPDGVLAEKRMFLGDSREYGRWCYHQHVGGRIAEAEWRNSSGEVEARETFDYAPDGLTAVRTRESVGEWLHEYDQRGREIFVSGGPYSGAAVESITYEYDAAGHLLTMVELGPEQRITTFTQERS